MPVETSKNHSLSSESFNDNLSRIDSLPQLELGQWYWTINEEGDREELGCVTEIGSNYVQISLPREKGCKSSKRFGFKSFFEKLEFEPNHKSYFQHAVEAQQAESNLIMNKIRQLTELLGVNQQIMIGGQQKKSDSMGVSVLSNHQEQLDSYKNSLVAAKEKDLPALYSDLKKSNEKLYKFLMADMLSVEATLTPMKETVEQINERLFNMSVYAGLSESALLIKEGEPAPIGTKVHVMQSKKFMDEECLLDYRAGGMEFKNISQFNDWLAKPDNFTRILPFDRCMVAMQVRRSSKNRNGDPGLDSYIRFRMEGQDKYTYLYIRNGEKVYQISTEFEFDELLFPAEDAFSFNEPMMVKKEFSRISLMPQREFDHVKAELEALEAKFELWKAENDGVSYWDFEHYDQLMSLRSDGVGGYEPLDSDSLLYDDAINQIRSQTNKHNRIALLLQGLFDRSDMLHPHGKVNIWEGDSFRDNVTLVYDGTGTLMNGDKPDFEAYKDECNASMGEGSVVYGQESAWEEREAEREANRRASGRRYTYEEVERIREYGYTPFGDPGPGTVAEISKWMPRSRKAKFEWQRERLTYTRYGDDSPVNCSITVSADNLFNISAYKVGDYKKFFNDPRTRKEYLKWAPALLSAEDYYAGQA
ncbi:MAG: hypothetical protein IBX55_00520 [Methyloprofundus sp.]|nr:hypothetical protein [Methyloprofundus sp.]